MRAILMHIQLADLEPAVTLVHPEHAAAVGLVCDATAVQPAQDKTQMMVIVFARGCWLMMMVTAMQTRHEKIICSCCCTSGPAL